MADSKIAMRDGYEPATDTEPARKAPRTLAHDADRAQEYLMWRSMQKGRIPIEQLGFHPTNRGGQKVMAPHVHNVAADIAKHGTSHRRYWTVRVVEVPETERQAWAISQQDHANRSPLLPRVSNIEPLRYACMTCTHFVHACKLMKAGRWRYMNLDGGAELKLLAGDSEGNLIQEVGVNTLIYSSELWYVRQGSAARSNA